jgi:hypothetical protein
MLEKNPPDLCHGQSFPQPDAAADPIAMARRELNKALPIASTRNPSCRNENEVSPCRSIAVRPRLRAAMIWRCQRWRRRGRWQTNGRRWAEIIDPALVPLTRLVNSAIDGVAPRLAITVAEIAKYAGSDLVC